ncbi:MULTISPECIES: hypothetical protein [Xenorhabdus]|uniref:Uncharacterized protein n=1 Tax=Xenorhabdus khoisanae TaxID=880157 RepID=A0A0J5IP49_9GAMM|nr:MULTISPECIES: hypothetical protein [Xenorhabdus]KLU17125.1 hypothetical protein AAY47_01520 [Xenorhabdus griffiniae]KMJ44980.1 hypothetical protein AB204_11595 [Xenorhabdus khoisanae]KOP31680.1 hypothetical protein AFK69_19480 [Xenorhabdus sp. GDc328]
MRSNAFNHSNAQNLFIDHDALEHELELDNQIAEQIEENRRHLRLKLRIADEIRKERETYKHPSACENISLSFYLLDKTPIYSNGTELFRLKKDFSREPFYL